jgi:peptidoglycan/LPS O-acetylase OafA/YrhL
MKNQSSQRIPELDGVRGIAILLVLVGHLFLHTIVAGNKTPLAYLVKLLKPFTVSGVDLFFVLSGFLIGGILLDNRASLNYFRAFYARRIFRIFPLYFAWLALFYILSILALGTRLDRVFTADVPFWHYWLFTQNFAMASPGAGNSSYLWVTWSLAIEEQFYLIAPLAIFLTPPRYLFRAIFIVLLSGVLARAAIASLMSTSALTFIYLTTYTRLDGLLCGVLCAILVRDSSAVEWLRDRKRFLNAGVFGVVIAVSLVALNTLSWFNQKLQAQYLFFAIGYSSFLLLILTQNKSWATSLVRSKLLQKLGILAYGIYIIHMFIYQLLHMAVRGKAPDVNSPIGAAISIASFLLTAIIAHCSWVYFERPLVNLGRQMKYKHAGSLDQERVTCGSEETLRGVKF